MKNKYKNIGSIITRTIEEMSELTKILCKCDRFGWSNYHPGDKSKTPNYYFVNQEIGDVERMLSKLKIKMSDEIENSQNGKLETAHQQAQPTIAELYDKWLEEAVPHGIVRSYVNSFVKWVQQQ